MTAGRRYSKTINLLIIFSALSCAVNIHADTPPNADSVNQLIELAKISREAFFKDSFLLRMKYECSGDLLRENDRLELRRLCERTISDLSLIEQRQKKLQQQIEDYQGDDWERRYGATGLWRKIAYENQAVSLHICEINFYYALAYTQLQKQQYLRAVLDNFKKLEKSSTPRFGLLQARISAALGQTEQLESILAELAEGSAQEDTEIILSLAFLQRRQQQFDSFGKTLELLPQVIDFAGELIFDEIDFNYKNGEPVEKVAENLNPIEAELIAKQITHKRAWNYRQLLETMIDRKEMRLPGVLYAAAFSISEDEPKKACQLLIEAARLQQKQKSIYFDIEAYTIAEHAARIAYNIYKQSPNNIEFAASIFYDYKKIADVKIDEDIEWLFVQMHLQNFDASAGVTILREIRQKDGKYARQAALYLAAFEVRNDIHEDTNERVRLLNEFSVLLKDFNDCTYQPEALGLVEDTLMQIEIFDPNTAKKMLEDCQIIAGFCALICDFQYAQTLLAESILINPESSNDTLKHAEKLIGKSLPEEGRESIGQMRCYARLQQRLGNYCKAAKTWEEIAMVHRNKIAGSVNHSWQWWRAKYWELYCLSNCQPVKKEDIIRAIEILQTGFSDIPALWAEKLDMLKNTAGR